MSQLPLPLSWTSASRRSDLIEGDANRTAIDLLSRPDLWPSHCTLIVGPPRSGRSIIAAMVSASGIADVIDDAPSVPEATLFHRWNAAREAGTRLALVADAAPPLWSIALPDLRSRLAAAGIARIGPPDEALTAALVERGLREAGTPFAVDVPRYLATRLPRDYELIERAVAALNRHSLGHGLKISVAVAKSCLEPDKDAGHA